MEYWLAPSATLTMAGSLLAETSMHANSQRPQLTFSELASAATEEEFLLHHAALEWSLADPIIIESAADVKSRVSWQDRVNPFHHQMQNLMTFCRRLPVTLIADDVGLGKTISAGLILSELMVRRRVNRTLVLCPSILGPQWIEEMESKFGILGRFATGTQLNTELRGEIPLVVTTYESGSARLESLEPGAFDMLILDEAHKLRNLYGSPKAPKLAQRVHRVLGQRLFKYVLMLTATPIQNRLWDLYTLIDCLAVAKGHANPLGSPENFKNRFIRDPTTARSIQRGAIDEFRAILRQYLVRTRRDQVRLLFPKRQVELLALEPTSLESQLQSLVARHIKGLHGFQQSSLLQAMMSSPDALIAQLDNMGERNPLLSALASEVRLLGGRDTEPSKLRGLLNIVEKLRASRPQDWRLVVFTTRKETQRVIGEALNRRGIQVGFIRGGEQQRNRATVKAYSSTPPTVSVIVSTDAGAEGLNLQAGNVVVNYDLPWNPMVVEQRIGRVQRLAAKFGHVVVINLAVKDSPEARVVARLMEKLQTISDTVGDIEAILEAASDGRDDTGSSFEATIRELVVKSLIGQNVEKATALAEESIQKARDLFDQQRHEIDEKLGDLSELHDAGPAMPKLATVLPKTGFQEFVSRALRAEGAVVIPEGENHLLVRRPRQPQEEITFDEATWQSHRNAGVFHGRMPKLYIPGKPAFERLVERWLNRSAHRVYDLRSVSQSFESETVHKCIESIEGAEISETKVVNRARCFQGVLSCKITASNALDSYEKLLYVPHCPERHSPISRDVTQSIMPMRDELQPEESFSGIAEPLTLAVESDPDMLAFAQFYNARLADEIEKAGSSSDRRKKITDDLHPALHAQVVAIEGIQYEVCDVDAEFAIDGFPGYCLRLQVVPATGQVLTSILWELCQATDRRLPAECLERCEVTGKRVLRHLLATSDVSGRRMLRQHTAVCGITGKVASLDEFAESDVSGTKAVKSEFVASAISGRKGLLNECVRCEVTGARVLNDELRRSEVTERLYRNDEEATSVLSGIKGHRSEFIKCSFTGDFVLSSESIASDLDGQPIRQDLIVRSEKPPFRVGAPNQTIKCAESGATLLRDEATKCAVTGKMVNVELLAPSDESGRLALKDSLVECNFTKKRMLPEESVVSAVSGKPIVKSAASKSPVSGRYAAPDEYVRCEVTNASVLPDEVIESDVTRRRFRRDQVAISEFSGRKGHASEAVRCDFSSRMLLQDEAAISEISGKRTARSQLIASEKSGRLGARTEMGRCAVSGRLLAPDETGRSVVSGMVVDLDFLVPSETSGKLALKDELVVCQASAAFLLPDETSVCCASGKRVDIRLLVRSELSGSWALQDHVAKCAISGKLGLVNELHKCQLTGDLVAPGYLDSCCVSGLKVRRDRLVRSDVSGRLLQPQLAIKSIIDGKVCCPDEAAFCHWKEGYVLANQAARCRRTQLTFSRDLIDESGEFCVLRQVMVGRIPPIVFDDLLPMLRSRADRKLASASRAWGAVSPRGGIRAVCVELSEYFGLRIRYASLIAYVRDDRKVLGQITVDAKNPFGWDVL